VRSINWVLLNVTSWSLLTGALSIMVIPSAKAEEPTPAPSSPTSTTGWFNLPLPGPATDQVLDFSHLDLPMIAAPSVLGAPELEGHKVHQYLEDIVKFSYDSRDAGDRTWGRLAGTRWAEATVDYVTRQFRESGIKEVTKIEVPFRGPEQLATDWHLTLVGEPEFGVDSADVELKSAFPMSQAAEGGAGPAIDGDHPPRVTLAVTAPVVYIGAASAADIATKEIKGKIVVMRVEPAPALFYSTGVHLSQQLVNAGAASVIVIYDSPGNMQVHFGSCKNVPCFTVGGEDGEFLMTVIAKAAAAHVLDKLRLSLSQTIETTPKAHGYMLVARVPGRRSDENLVLSAHSDAWFSGANDNASGVAALIALANHYAKGPRPQHDMYFLLSPGHHSPTGAAQRFVELYPAIPRTNILTINLEHIGQQGVYKSYFNPRGMGPTMSKYGNFSYVYVPVNWDSPGREISGAPMTPTLKRVLAEAASRTQFTGPARITGGAVAELAPMVAAGATGLQDVETSIWYHTSGDTPSTVAPESLQRVLLFYKDVLDHLDKLSRSQVREGLQ
jgi:hypothetical protein